MRRMPRATYLWPGLPHLWTYGLWPGLVLAIGCGVLLDLLLLASLVWVELLSPLHLRLGWLSLVTVWSVAAITTALGSLREPTVEGISAEDLFRSALSEYLQGSWFEAEAILNRLLRVVPGDVEARLLLATLLRHTGRFAAALEELDRLEHLRDADTWSVEIASERRAIDRAVAERSAEQAAAITAPSSQTRYAA